LFLSLQFLSKAQLQPIYNQSEYPFWLHLPSDSILKSKPPILIFLHGRSLSGNNLELVKKYGVIHEIEKGRSIPAIVIAPQVPAGKSWEPEKILSVLQFVQRTFDTDTNRVYVA
jgi:predicted peptidase